MENESRSDISSLCSVVVLNYNGKEFLTRCLLSLKNLNYKDYNVIVVDNASSDGSVDFVREHFPWVHIIENKENLGFAEGNNVAIKHAKGDYILFLNNDTEVDSDWLENMVKTARSDSSIGIVGCKMLYMEQKNVIDAVGFLYDEYGFPYARGIGETDHHQYDYVADVFSAVGAAMLVKREVLEKIGVFDSKYFMLSDELDLCWRAQLAGYRVVVNPFAVMYHKSRGTFKKSCVMRSWIRFLNERNILRTLIKNYSGLTLLKILPRYFALLFTEFLLFVLIRKDLALADIKAVLWNFKNFRETWYLHKKIQQMRVIDDKAIRRKMIQKSIKILLFRRLGREFFVS